MTALISGGTVGTPGPVGLTSGRVLRTARDGLGLSQESLASHLSVDVNTLKGWETGRRPLGNVKTGTLRGIVRNLRTLGAPAVLGRDMGAAIDVDLTIGSILAETRSDGADRVETNPLAHSVTTRHWNRLLAGTIAGPGAAMSVTDRGIFVDRLQSAVEVTLRQPQRESFLLLRRQALYILASTRSSEPGWMSDIAGATSRTSPSSGSWTPLWVAARSLAITRASGGDRQALRDFIDTHLRSDSLEAANLNYWAYWLEDDGVAPEAVSDSFMTGDLGNWRGARLMQHLVEGLDLAVPHLELCIHSLWALLFLRPTLLDPDTAPRLARRCADLLDLRSADTVGHFARKEADQLHYAARMALPRGL